MHKAHEIIWLQVDPDGESCDLEQWSLEDGATWCKDQINADDIKYVRADTAEAKLAAEQAKNVGLREALENHSGNYKLSKEECTKINALLDAPSDTSALEAIVKKAGEVMREKCAKEAERDACPAYEYVSDCVPAKGIAKAIRYLPAVTLEDLK